jgi:hypothetical protein
VVELLPPVVDTPLAADLDPSFPRISPEKLVAALIKGLKNNTDEITPGQSAQLKLNESLSTRTILFRAPSAIFLVCDVMKKERQVAR